MRILDWATRPRIHRLVDAEGRVPCPVQFRDLDAAGCATCSRLVSMDRDAEGAITRMECRIDLPALLAAHPDAV